MINTTAYGWLKWQILIFLFIFRGLSLPPAMAQASLSEWFRVHENALQYWELVPGDHPLQASLHARYSASGLVRKILFIYPYASSAYDIAISRVLEIFAEKRIAAIIYAVNFQNQPSRGRALVEKAQRDQIDLIFAMGSDSVTLLIDQAGQFNIPVVSICAKDPVLLGQIKDYEQGSGNNFAFTSLNTPIDLQMIYLLELKPELRNIGILVDRRNISAVQTQAEPLARAAHERNIQPFMITVDHSDKTALELAEKMPAALIKMQENDPDLTRSLWWITGSTSVFREIETINHVAGKVPVLAAVPDVVKAGDHSAVLSIGVSFESNAELAAIYGAAILRGQSTAGELKVGVVAPPDIAVNFRRAHAIGLKIPFSFFEAATYIYGYDGQAVRVKGVAQTIGLRTMAVETPTTVPTMAVEMSVVPAIPLPEPEPVSPAKEPPPASVTLAPKAICDPSHPYIFSHPASKAQLELNRCVIKAGEPGLLDIPPLSYSLTLLIQKNLNDLGFKSGRADGRIGPVTRQAIRRFQLAQGMAATGIIDFVLLERIQQSMTRKKSRQRPASERQRH